MDVLRSRTFVAAEILLVVLNVIDAAFTHLWLTSGAASEANPLLAMAWDSHPLTFHSVKAALVLGGAAILHQLRWIQAARTAMEALAVAYGAVVAWHLVHL